MDIIAAFDYGSDVHIITGLLESVRDGQTQFLY